MDVIEDGNVIEWIFVIWKARSPIEEQEAGNVIFFSCLHPLNASLPIFVMVEASVTEERKEQFTNAEAPTLVTPVLMITEVISLR